MAVKITTATLALIGMLVTGWLSMGLSTPVMSHELAPIIQVAGSYLDDKIHNLRRESLDIRGRLADGVKNSQYKRLLNDRLQQINTEILKLQRQSKQIKR